MEPPDVPPRPVELHRWLARAILAIVAGLIPWTAYLAWSLPRHFQAHNWRLAWVGFDAALIAVLAYTAWAAWARRQILAPVAIAAATMLICDAWFDVNTSFGTRGEALTIVTALGGNLPLALVLILLARRIMLRSAAMLAEARGARERPRHAHEVTMAFPTTWHGEAAEAKAHLARVSPDGSARQHTGDIVARTVDPLPASPPETAVPQTGRGGTARGGDQLDDAGAGGTETGTERSGDGHP